MNMQTTSPAVPLNHSTSEANTETLISPRFYTTDFDALDKIDLTGVRAEWDQMMSEFEADGNVDHFVRDASFKDEIKQLPDDLMEEFLGFLVSSVTSEYSGCVLYGDIEQRISNPDIKKLMGYMRRDEARHAGFINRALKDFGEQVDLGFLKREKKTKYFKPKFIYYATYLSEKIGYARYITIFRLLQKHPERRFHPIFRWFERWCNDEFRHGEAFALMMRADPSLLRGGNRLWIRFFLLAVYATMFVRDHSRPLMHEAFGIDIEDYDMQVFQITSAISRQVFPFTLDIEHPQWLPRLRRLLALQGELDALPASRSPLNLLRKARIGAAAAYQFARLYCLPTVPNDIPSRVRVAPAW
jgi:magnesium-protoporphyrin IX monomethyl ester (oxidative) cyclase